MMRSVSDSVLSEMFALMHPHLGERQRRLLAGAQAGVLGHGGIRMVARAAGMDPDTVSRGVRELRGGVDADVPVGRSRRSGGGRRRLAVTDPELTGALLDLVEPDARGGSDVAVAVDDQVDEQSRRATDPPGPSGLGGYRR
jgi:hypothetical protein